MSDTSGIPAEAPAAPAAAEPGVGDLPTEPNINPAPAAAAEPEPLHPAWEKALNGMPDLLRKPFEAQIRESDKRAQAAIEAARGNIPQEWQRFYEEAKAGGVTPQELVDSYNSALAIRQDPIKFQQDLTAAIQAKIDKGEITLAQGQQLAVAATAKATADAQQLTDEPNPLESPEVKALKEQLATVQQQVGGLTQAQKDEQQRRQNESDKQQYDAFFNNINSKLEGVGLHGASNDTLIAVAQQADAILKADPTGRLTEDVAIGQAIERLKQAAAAIANPQPSPVLTPPIPVQGGSAALPVPPGTKFKTEDEREAAMLAEAARLRDAE